MSKEDPIENKIDRGAESIKRKVRVVKKATQLLKSRTVKFSLALSILSVVQGFIATLPLTPMHQMFIGLGIAVVSICLRALTKLPVDEL